MIGWWEEISYVVGRIIEKPGYVWEGRDVNAFNVELIGKFSAWSETDLSIHYENVRRSLMELVEELPDDAFRNQDIESWLAAVVVEHFNEHAL